MFGSGFQAGHERDCGIFAQPTTNPALLCYANEVGYSTFVFSQHIHKAFRKWKILSLIMTATWQSGCLNHKVAVRSASRSGTPSTASPLAEVAARYHKSGCENHKVVEGMIATFPLSEGMLLFLPSEARIGNVCVCFRKSSKSILHYLIFHSC